MDKIKTFFKLPPVELEDDLRSAKLLKAIIYILSLIAALRIVLTILTLPQNLLVLLKLNGLFLLILAAVFLIMKVGRIKLACFMFTFLQWSSIAWITYRYGGVNMSAYGFFIFVIFSSGLLLGGKWALGYALASVLYGLLLLTLEAQGLISPFLEKSFTAFTTLTPSFVTTAIIVYLYCQEIMIAINQAREKASLLELTNTELKNEISKRVNMEKRLLQAQKMEAIGTLSGGIAHDFNNILSGIFGYSQLVEININNPDKAAKYIKRVVTSANRAAGLVQQILTYSRQTEYQKQPIKLYLEINGVLNLLRSTIPTSIEINKQLNSKAYIMADTVKIHQVIMNLCTNAYHSMRKTGGQLTILLDDVHISQTTQLKNNLLPPETYLKLTVSDTGQGMDKKTLERAFDPYYTTKKAGDGTGLGLSIVKAIIEEHNALLEVNSEPGKGTNFFIYFPVVEKQSRSDTSQAKDVIQFNGNETIMMVDDEEAIRKTFKKTLEIHGYKIHLFKNGLDALNAFKMDMEKFDLILTDMAMPEMTGEKLAIEILKLKPHIPIILCTGFSENLSKSKTMEMGIREYIQKPVDMKDLLSTIRKIFD